MPNDNIEHPLDGRIKPSTLVDILRWRAGNEPDAHGYTFLADGEDKEFHLTYAELDRRARAIATRLHAAGSAGQPVLLVFPSGLQYVEAFFGCLFAGSIAVVAYPPRPNRSLDRFSVIARASEARVILTLESIRSQLEPLVAEMGGPALSWITTDGVDESAAEDWAAPDIDSDSLALIQYTSGSTAAPKGTMVSHLNLLHNSRLICRAFSHTKETIVVGWLPMTHDMGLIGNMLQPLYLGCPYIFMSPESFLMKPVRWLRAISRYRATTSGAPNFAYDFCCARIKPEQKEGLDLTSWDLAYNGAERVRAETMDRFAAVFSPYGFRRDAFYPCYGLAEATLMVTGGTREAPTVEKIVNADALREKRVELEPDAEKGHPLVGCGRARAGQQVLIVDPDTFQRCPDGHIGEVWISGPSVAQGYWKSPRETDEVFHAHVKDAGDGPFLRTGDLGFIDDGEIYITGRLKDLIIIGGANHFPVDIEITVEKSHRAVRPTCVAAIAVEAEGTERLVIVAEVGRKFPVEGLDEVTEAIRGAVSQTHDLATEAICLIQQSTIPKTASGKVQRHLCREQYLNGTLSLLTTSSET